MIYYNQNTYGHIPYPSQTNPGATVKTGGCGAVCAAMIVENLLGPCLPPPEAAALALSSKARVNGGTDMKRLAEALCGRFPLIWREENTLAALLAHLDGGGMAIANVGGDRPGHTGVFSNAGHYVVAFGLRGDELTVLDPGDYAGKFNRPGRSGKVRISGSACITSPGVLHADAENRRPRYYLFARKGGAEMDKLIFNRIEDLPDWGRPAVEKLIKIGALRGDDAGLRLSEEMARIFTVLDRLGIIAEEPDER